jgi:hypothetical protein
LLHIIIQHGYPTGIPDILINEKITPDLAGDLKVHTAGIIFIVIGIHDFLGRYSKAGERKSNAENPVSAWLTVKSDKFLFSKGMPESILLHEQR